MSGRRLKSHYRLIGVIPEESINADGDADVYQIKGDGMKTKTTQYESLDYDTCYNVPLKVKLNSYTKFTYFHVTLMRWVLACLIGVVTGFVAFLINISRRKLGEWKYDAVEKVIGVTVPYGFGVLGLLVLLGFNILYSLISLLLTAWEPASGGSGVPEIKSYLNGVKVPLVGRFNTIFSKAVGLTFSTAGGYLAGIEGPMLFMGGFIGEGISQLRSFLPVLKRYPLPYDYFRSDREKRDFATHGAAAGVAAAFGAPIGGTLLSLEEASSFWNQSLTWRTLFCAFSATFTYNLLQSAYISQPGVLASPGLINLGSFNKVNSETGTLWTIPHLFVFIFMAVIAGLLGSLYNSLYISMQLYRSKYLMKRKYKKSWRVLEGLMIVMATTMLGYLCCMFLSTCVVKEIQSEASVEIQKGTRMFFCPDSNDPTYINDFATILLNSAEAAIPQLYHLKNAFSITTLGIVLIFYYFIFCWTYGAAIPIGFFVPCIFVGALYGRLFVTIFEYMSINNVLPGLSSFITSIYPGAYAVIGSAAFLGGTIRMNISLTVLMIEATQLIQFGLPIMITVMVSKWVGDLFNDGIYHIGIHLKKYPYLDWETPEQLDSLIAEDVMSKNLSFLYPITRVSSIVELLKTTHYNAFPVVTPFNKFTKPPQNVSIEHVPVLYKHVDRDVHQHNLSNEPSVLRARTTFKDRTRSTYQRRTQRRTTGESEEIAAQYEDENGLSYSYSVEATPSRAHHTEKPQQQYLVLHGMILRSQLVTLVKNKVYFTEHDQPDSQKVLTHKEMMADYPRFCSINDIDISEENKQMLMDLTLYMTPCPFTVSNQAPLPQVFTLFRTMGLRHLPVIKASGLLAGIITRHDISHTKLHELTREKH